MVLYHHIRFEDWSTKTINEEYEFEKEITFSIELIF